MYFYSAFRILESVLLATENLLFSTVFSSQACSMLTTFSVITGPPTHSVGGQYCFAPKLSSWIRQ